jgi:hypothetical protein
MRRMARWMIRLYPASWRARRGEEIEHPTRQEALTITRRLRVEGNLPARLLAEQIEQACRAC